MSAWEVVLLVFMTMVATLLLVWTGWKLAQGGDGSKEFGSSWDIAREPADHDPAMDAIARGLADDEPPALKIDPENPPTWKIYSPPVNKQAPFCNCHGRPIRQGENILMWPDPEDEGAYRLFHKDFVDGLGADL